MKIVGKIPYLIIAGFIYLLIYNSCANQGMPTGGPKDSLPPVIVRTDPEFGGLNFRGNEIRLTFNEYVAMDKVMDLLVVSPPLQKKPTLKMKSKTLILQFNEDLRDSVTYSLDFKNAIEDNNERNPYKSLRFSFSTWDVYDSLRVAGVVKNAENHEPVDKGLVLLHKNLHDSAVFKLIPDYVAKTDKNGIFFIDNIAPGKYNIFSINDANSDMKYNEGIEEISFIDSLIIPEARYFEELDTIAKGADSLLISGYIHFLPEPVYMLRFMENIFSQFLTSATRESKYKCRFIFEEPVADTFGLTLLNFNSENWYMLEPNPTMDSITLWISDTLVANLDTINLEVMYNQLDSTGSVFLKKDTLDLINKEEKKEPVKRKRKEDDTEEAVVVPKFTISDNLSSTGFDLNIPVYLTTPEPVKYFNYDQVHLYVDADTTGTPLEFSIEKDTTAWRRYKLSYNWEANTEYRVEVDSAASENIYGLTNSRLMKKFKTQKDDFYGAIIIEAKNITGPVIIQLLKGDEKEQFIKSKTVENDGLVVFDYLAPTKYILKAIYDTNRNGKWDTGSFQDHYQPEKVAYFQTIVKVRSNWEQKEAWDLTINPEYPKVLYDAEAEAEKKKAQEEELKKNSQPSGNNNTNSGSPRTFGRQQ